MIQVLVGATVPERDITESISGLSYSSANPGGFASCNFTVPGRALYRYVNQLRTDARVWVKCGPKTVWEGFIVNDPEAVKFGDSEDVPVECAGNLEVAKRRKDYAKTWLDMAYDVWFPRRDDQYYTADTEGELKLLCESGTVVPAGKSYALYYWIDAGLGGDDIAYITFDAAWAVGTYWEAYLQYSTSPWGSFSTANFDARSETSPVDDFRCPASGSFAAGTKSVRFVLEQGGASSQTASADRYITVTDVHVYSATGDSLDDYMADVANDIASTVTQSTIAYGGSAVIRPFMTRAEAIDYLASLHSAPVDWGFWEDDSFAVAARATTPAVVDHLIVDASDAGVDWDVQRIAEDACDAVCVMYGAYADATYPDGTVRTVYRAADPGTADSRVHLLDYSSQILSATQAQGIGDQYLDYMENTQHEGTVTVVGSCKRVDGVPVRACEMRAGHWVENLDEYAHAPRFVSHCDYDRDSDTATLTIGDARGEFKHMMPPVWERLTPSLPLRPSVTI